MHLDELADAEILILGFGREGKATYAFLRNRWPGKTADDSPPSSRRPT
jgi:hypothetical protein